MGPFGILYYSGQHKSLMALLQYKGYNSRLLIVITTVHTFLFSFLFFYYHPVRVPLVCLKKNLNASRPSKLNATRPSEHQPCSNIGSNSIM